MSFGRFQLRRDTAANWSSANPVLAEGELAIDLTNNIFKIGDGTTAWSSLPIGGAASNAAINDAIDDNPSATRTALGFDEAVDDRVAALLVAGTGITLTYNDVANTLTIDSSGGGGGGGYSFITSAALTGTNSASFTDLGNKTSLLIVIDGAANTVGSDRNLQISYSTNNGSSYSTALNLGPPLVSGGAVMSGTINFLRNDNALSAHVMLAAGGTSPAAATPAGQIYKANVDAIRISLSFGANFTGGTIYLYAQ